MIESCVIWSIMLVLGKMYSKYLLVSRLVFLHVFSSFSFSFPIGKIQVLSSWKNRYRGFNGLFNGDKYLFIHFLSSLSFVVFCPHFFLFLTSWKMHYPHPGGFAFRASWLTLSGLVLLRSFFFKFLIFWLMVSSVELGFGTFNQIFKNGVFENFHLIGVLIGGGVQVIGNRFIPSSLFEWYLQKKSSFSWFPFSVITVVLNVWGFRFSGFFF